MARAFVTAILDNDVDEATRDRLGDELMVEYDFDAITALAGVAATLLRAVPGTDPADQLRSQQRRHPDAETRALVDEVVLALLEDVTGRSQRFLDAVTAAGATWGQSSIRDLGLVAAGAAWDAGEALAVAPAHLMAQLAVLDEQRAR